MKTYRKRVADDVLAFMLEGAGAVLVEGVKWCGKTTTALQTAKSTVNLDEMLERDGTLSMARAKPGLALDGDPPRLVDEWQLAPWLWDAIRRRVDRADGQGRFILTGSSVPADTDEILHSGAGRFAWMKMRPMSLWESGESSGTVSLGGLFERPGDFAAEEAKKMELEEIAFAVCRGGWPKAVGLSRGPALQQAFNYVDALVERDISRVDGTLRDPGRARRLLRSYARLQGTQASASAILADLAANRDGGKMGEETVYSYLAALRKVFAVEDAKAWCPNTRCKTPVRTADTRYFVDPSIATAALGLGPDDLVADLTTFGLVFETMAMRDLRVYAEPLHGEVCHYRDKQERECDAVVHLRNGRYGLVEFKLGGAELVEKGAAAVKKLASLVDTDKMREPSFLMVLTAVGDYAYRREDGVIVCPVAALKP